MLISVNNEIELDYRLIILKSKLDSLSVRVSMKRNIFVCNKHCSRIIRIVSVMYIILIFYDGFCSRPPVISVIIRDISPLKR